MSEIAYYKTAKPLLNIAPGAIVVQIEAKGSECLWINGVQLPYEYLAENPDCFTPVYVEEHKATCLETLRQIAHGRGVSLKLLQDTLVELNQS